jgi:hypothetical protein
VAAAFSAHPYPRRVGSITDLEFNVPGFHTSRVQHAKQRHRPVSAIFNVNGPIARRPSTPRSIMSSFLGMPAGAKVRR